MPLKIAVSGKGGVGKTTVAAGLCIELAARGHAVLALDCDPDANLAEALGFPPDLLAAIRPLAALDDLIEERTGAKPGGYGAMFKLNPHVADIPDSHCHRHGPFRLLVMEGAEGGGRGCDCAQNSLMRRIVSEVVLRRDEAVVMDMEAGLEHLGRGTARAVDAIVAVVEPGRRSLATARRVAELAADLGIARVGVLGNRFDDGAQLAAFVGDMLAGVPLLGALPFDAGIAEADRLGVGLEAHLGAAARRVLAGVLDTFEEAAS